MREFYSRGSSFSRTKDYQYPSVSTMKELHLLNTIRLGTTQETRRNECKQELIKRWSTPSTPVAPVVDTLVSDLVKELTA